MKNLLLITFSSLLIFSPLGITSAHQHSNKSHMSMSMMDDASMEKMNEHITKMNKTLEKIKQENDPAKREQMLNEHANSMQDMMGMMHHSKKRRFNDLLLYSKKRSYGRFIFLKN